MWVLPRVKSQARGQNNWSRALKWGTVCICSSKNNGDLIKNKKYHFFIDTVVSQKVFELQRHTIPNFKALDQLFWPLA